MSKCFALFSALSKVLVLCINLKNLIARFEVISIKEDTSTLRLSRIIDMLEMVSRDVKSLKDRQDLLFRKQDMLQSTLAGEVEIPLGQAHSRSVSSILAWSSEPGSPAHPRFERPRETPPVKQPPPGPQYAPVYAPPAHSLVDSHSVYAYSVDDVSSFLSEQWEGSAADTASVVTHGSFVPPAVSLQGAGPSQQTTPYCPLPDVQLSELSCVSGPRNTISALPLNTSVSQNPPSTNRGVSENPPPMNRRIHSRRTEILVEIHSR